MGQRTPRMRGILVGLLLVSLSVILSAFTPFTMFVLLLIAPILLAFFTALYFRRYLGAIAIATYVLIATSLTMISSLLNTPSTYTLKDALFSILMIVGLLLIISQLRPERGHGKERGITAIFIVLLLGIYIASIVLIPPKEVSLHAADLYVLYNLILLAVLTAAFTIIRIIIAYVSRDYKNLILSDLLIDINLVMLTVGMLSVPVIYFDIAGMCSCSGCFSTIAPGLTTLMISLIAPSTAMLLGHIYGVMRR